MSKIAEQNNSRTKTLIISDLHLVSEELEKTGLFIKFCQNEAKEADQLFILGDLFNSWLGDDLSIANYQNVIEALKSLSQDTNIYVMAGNRDFLLGNKFKKESGCKILIEPHFIDNNNKRYVLIHGDTLCTDDIDYQKLKKILQHPITKFIFLRLPKKLRLRLSGQLRKKSVEAQKYKSKNIMDVNTDSVDKFMSNHPNTDLIHGHTHRKRVHNNEGYTRYVLGDWYVDRGSAIKLEDGLDFIEIN